MHEWDLFSNHGLTLICIARQPGSRVRDIADCVGITERAASRIVGDLCERGLITRTREGRRNRYEIVADKPLGHMLTDGVRVGDLLAPFTGAGPLPSR
jgi:DNA-binding MarR family transcriptional regulator